MCLGLGNHCLCVQVCVCQGLGSHHLCSMCFCFVCLTKKTTFTIAYALCASTICISIGKQHQHRHHQPTFVTPLLCVHLQKMTSMLPLPTYILSTSILCTFPRRCHQCCHRQCCLGHQSNQLFFTLNQKFLNLLYSHVVGF